jgi:hypothetical protein
VYVWTSIQSYVRGLVSITSVHLELSVLRLSDSYSRSNKLVNTLTTTRISALGQLSRIFNFDFKGPLHRS